MLRLFFLELNLNLEITSYLFSFLNDLYASIEYPKYFYFTTETFLWDEF